MDLNLHALAHDFDSQTSDLKTYLVRYRRPLRSIGCDIPLDQWMEFHGALLSNYEAWLRISIGIKPSAQVVWPIVGQDILKCRCWADSYGIQITLVVPCLGVVLFTFQLLPALLLAA